MLQFAVDNDKCIRCGLCVEDCPLDILAMPEDGCPEVVEKRAKYCIRCQHCLAVCKPGALSIFGLDPEDSTPLKGNLPDPEQLETLVRGRRSVRRFRKQPVEQETIDAMLRVLAYAPTGKNNLRTLFTVVDDPEVMNRLRHATYEGVRRAVEEGNLPKEFGFFKGIIRAWDKGRDILFRDAPHLLTVSAPKDGPSPEADCLVALSYFDLLASGRGLGTLWNGFVKWALTIVAPEVGRQLNIPEDHVIGYMMLFGKPAVKYHRTVQRDGAVAVSRVTM